MWKTEARGRSSRSLSVGNRDGRGNGERGGLGHRRMLVACILLLAVNLLSVDSELGIACIVVIVVPALGWMG